MPDEAFEFFSLLSQLLEFANIIYHSVVRFLQYIDYSTVSLNKVKKAHRVIPIVTEEKLHCCLTIFDLLEPNEKLNALFEESEKLFSGSLEGPETKYIISSYRILFPMLHSCKRECEKLMQVSEIIDKICDPSLISWEAFIEKIPNFLNRLISSWPRIIPSVTLPLSTALNTMNAPDFAMWDQKIEMLRTAVNVSTPDDDTEDVGIEVEPFKCACRR